MPQEPRPPRASSSRQRRSSLDARPGAAGARASSTFNGYLACADPFAASEPPPVARVLRHSEAQQQQRSSAAADSAQVQSPIQSAQHQHLCEITPRRASFAITGGPSTAALGAAMYRTALAMEASTWAANAALPQPVTPSHAGAPSRATLLVPVSSGPSVRRLSAYVSATTYDNGSTRPYHNLHELAGFATGPVAAPAPRGSSVTVRRELEAGSFTLTAGSHTNASLTRSRSLTLKDLKPRAATAAGEAGAAAAAAGGGSGVENIRAASGAVIREASGILGQPGAISMLVRRTQSMMTLGLGLGAGTGAGASAGAGAGVGAGVGAGAVGACVSPMSLRHTSATLPATATATGTGITAETTTTTATVPPATPDHVPVVVAMRHHPALRPLLGSPTAAGPLHTSAESGTGTLGAGTGAIDCTGRTATDGGSASRLVGRYVREEASGDYSVRSGHMGASSLYGGAGSAVVGGGGGCRTSCGRSSYDDPDAACRQSSRPDVAAVPHNDDGEAAEAAMIAALSQPPMSGCAWGGDADFQPCARLASVPTRCFHLSTAFVFVAFLSTFAPAALLPAIQRDLHLSKSTVGGAGVAALATSALTHFLMAMWLRRLGPRYCQLITLLLTAPALACMALVEGGTGFVILRLLGGASLWALVVSQFWLVSTRRAPSLLAAIATCTSWGAAGGGASMIAMPLLYEGVRQTYDSKAAWHAAFYLPAAAHLVLTLATFMFGQDTEEGDFLDRTKRPYDIMHDSRMGSYTTTYESPRPAGAAAAAAGSAVRHQGGGRPSGDQRRRLTSRRTPPVPTAREEHEEEQPPPQPQLQPRQQQQQQQQEQKQLPQPQLQPPQRQSPRTGQGRRLFLPPPVPLPMLAVRSSPSNPAAMAVALGDGRASKEADGCSAGPGSTTVSSSLALSAVASQQLQLPPGPPSTDRTTPPSTTAAAAAVTAAAAAASVASPGSWLTRAPGKDGFASPGQDEAPSAASASFAAVPAGGLFRTPQLELELAPPHTAAAAAAASAPAGCTTQAIYGLSASPGSGSGLGPGPWAGCGPGTSPQMVAPLSTGAPPVRMGSGLATLAEVDAADGDGDEDGRAEAVSEEGAKAGCRRGRVGGSRAGGGEGTKSSGGGRRGGGGGGGAAATTLLVRDEQLAAQEWGYMPHAGYDTYIAVVLSPWTLLLALSYSCTFGAQLVFLNNLPIYLASHFGLKPLQAGGVACAFGLLNVVTRSSGAAVAAALSRGQGWGRWVPHTDPEAAMRCRLWLLWGTQAVSGLLCGLLGGAAGGSLAASVLLVLLFGVASQQASGMVFAAAPLVSLPFVPAVLDIVSAAGLLGGVVLQAAFFSHQGLSYVDGWLWMGVAVGAVTALGVMGHLLLASACCCGGGSVDGDGGRQVRRDDCPGQPGMKQRYLSISQPV